MSHQIEKKYFDLERLKESRPFLRREDSIELTNQYQRDGEATSAV